MKMDSQTVIRELNRLKTGQPTRDYESRDKAIERAKYCVKKIIPKKVVYGKWGHPHCPDCEQGILGRENFFCPYCGQRIEWSVDE